jgi:lipoxygenase homology domain-containing protein 1
MTSDIRFAGTAADVYIELHGEAGSVGRSALESSRHNFERNSTDRFIVKGPHIGAIKSIRIWHANNGVLGSDWHLAQVQVMPFLKA